VFAGEFETELLIVSGADETDETDETGADESEHSVTVCQVGDADIWMDR